MALTEEWLMPVPGLSSRWAKLASGARAHYVTSGDTGPAVILLHGGLPGSSGTAGWRFMAPYLGARGFRVYCPDQPGFGLADTRQEHWPQGPHSHVEFVHEFANALCLDEFHLSGNSMGGTTAVNYVVAHPERVLSYVLIGTDIGDVAPLERRPPAAAHFEEYDGSRESMRRLMAAIIGRDAAIEDELVEMRWRSAQLQRESRAQWWPTQLQYRGTLPWEHTDLQASLSTKGRFERLKIPALYLYGNDDVLTPVVWGHEQEDVLPHVQFFYPDGAGHQSQTDLPELFNHVYLEFFRDGRVSRATADRAGVSRRRPELVHLVEQV
ncbi:pimeloyl-ACP methyl ester carboxylesterase [Kribbella aluminosa]|uniref:Pimeloyl-ACP methyl ester carboxylesterase n=1 Tax=Kribbella aluminosa TaxID=416017 RepID=A0ABS4UIG6_9ACTN|nr:alpha/beta hydrolase [Kribbella aluminosa]MBP2351415.1 pimeloyl-ACP methyl ester carboxylesterase [Kribbella aluminosa]